MKAQLTLYATTQFRKDYKLAVKRGYKACLIEEVLDKLLCQEKLDEKYRDHALVGQYAGFRECHILPDWLLVYKVDAGKLILTAVRTGTHADLFDQ